MLFDSLQTKKIPRVLLAHGEDFNQKLSGAYVIWPDRGQSELIDISLSGMSIGAEGRLTKVLQNQSVPFELRIVGVEETLPLKARLVQTRSQSLGFLFESISSEGRLTLEQAIKDRLVTDNLKPRSPADLPSESRGDLWLHGPFDTNVILWNQVGSEDLRRAHVEYDNLTWIYENGDVHLFKSSTAVSQNQSYFQSASSPVTGSGKVSMGASWPDRLLKVLDRVNEREGSLSKLLLLLRRQRER